MPGFRISVVVPTFDRAGPLQRALESIRCQTLQPLEVIVVDDGSMDGTRSLVCGSYPEYRYLHQENRGVSSARNLGIRAASGDWIALLDSDDQWLPGRLAAQVALLQREPALLCHTDEIWIRNGRRVNPMKKHRKQGGWIFRHCLPRCVISPSAVLMHRSLLDEVGLFDESLPACEDYDLWLRVCARHPIAFIPQPQIRKYGGHPDQLSRRHWGMDRFRVRALEKIIHSGVLVGDDLQAAISMRVEKLGILANGAARRGRHEEAERYRSAAARCLQDRVDRGARRREGNTG